MAFSALESRCFFSYSLTCFHNSLGVLSYPSQMALKVGALHNPYFEAECRLLNRRDVGTHSSATRTGAGLNLPMCTPVWPKCTMIMIYYSEVLLLNLSHKQDFVWLETLMQASVGIFSLPSLSVHLCSSFHQNCWSRFTNSSHFFSIWNYW